jgi:hypothetical protein
MADNKNTKKNLDLEIVELVIQMHTNMDTQLELTADIVENKKLSGKNPFLCTNCKYSKDVLIQKPIGERFDIFFNRTKFYNFMLVSRLKKNQSIESRYDSNIVRENIIIMLNSLFQISFPIKEQVELMDDKSVDFENMIKNLFKSNEYTYLKLNKTSTVTQVIWLNTIGSNPIYYDIYQKNKKYNKKVMDYAETVDEDKIKQILKKNDEDNIKIHELQKYFKNNKIIYDVDKKEEVNKKKEEWILYFLVSNFKQKTKEYNEFIKNYIKKFINSEQNYNRYYGDNSQQNEKQFFESVPEIGFYQKYMSEIVELLPPKRVTVKKKIGQGEGKKEEDDIAEALKNVKQTNDFTKFNEIYANGKAKPCQLFRLENGAYEIHLGVAVVGGKVDKTNLKFLCNYNSHRLGNDFNFLIKNTGEDDDKVRLSTYIDLENVKDTTEYVGVINSSIKKTTKKKKGGNKKMRNKHTRNKQTRNKHTRNKHTRNKHTPWFQKT